MRNVVVFYRAVCFAFGLTLLCLWGCDFPPTANVNSGVQDFQTTQVRYVNLTASPAGHILQARFTVYEPSTRITSTATISTDTVKSFSVSQFFIPRADSSRISVISANTPGVTYNLALPLTFTARNASYTLVGLPPRAGNKAILDTLLILTTLPADTTANTANIRFVNCIADTTKTYSFTLGCPSGTPVGSNLAYRANSGVQPIALNGDNLSVAITEQERSISTNMTTRKQVGLFNLRSLSVRNSYTILLYRDADDKPALLALNDRAPGQLTVSSPSQPSTFLRVANFSGGTLNDVAYSTSKIASALANNTISTFATLTACASAVSDTIVIQRNSGILRQSTTTSLVVNGSQTLFLSDNLAIVAPALVVPTAGGSISVRTVNLSPESVSVLRGAIKQQRAQSLVSNLPSGSISAAVTLSREDVLPLIVFNTKQPQSLEQFGIASIDINSASSYFLVVAKNQLFLVPDVLAGSGSMQTQMPIQVIPQGTFVQALHVFSDATTGTAQMKLGSVFNDIVAYGAPQLTVLPAGSQSIRLGSKERSDTLVNGMRMVIVGIGIGTTTASRVLVETGLWSTSILDLYPNKAIGAVWQGSLRYLNATSDVDSLRVQPDSENAFSVTIPLGRGKFTTPLERFYRDQTRTLTFRRDTNETLFVARNLTFSVGRGYTIIFAGQRSNGYNAVVLPEY